MIRGTLLAPTVALALVTFSPSAFSAAVVHTGTLVSPRAAASGRVISQRDIDRLHVVRRGDVSAPRVSLANMRAESGLTLTGECAKIAGSEVILPDALAESAGIDAQSGAGLAASASAGVIAPAPPAGAAADGLGSASAFGAVPEPSSVVLLAIGAASLLRRRRS